MKKLIALSLACIMMLTMCTGVFAASFSDLVDARWDWARDTVLELAEKGIVKGYSDGTYQPANSITNQEAFTLFARTIGVNDDVNKDAVEAAQALYAPVCAKYNTYATKELCYMLYRGIFTEAEIDTYLSEERKNLPMQRHEAAILITKIMGGQKEVENTVIYVFDYTDADTIPAPSKGYIDFVTKKGIMKGMEDNTFSPSTSVTRAQVAIMLKRVMDFMNMTTSGGTISSIDYSAKTFVLNGKVYAINDETTINLDGEHAYFDDLGIGDEAIVTITNKGVWAIDAIEGEAQTIDAIYTGSFADARGEFIEAYGFGFDASSVQEYKLGDNVSYTYNGAPASLSNFAKDDRVYITLENEVVTSLEGESRIKTITDATVEEVIFSPITELRIAHQDPEYDGKTYHIDSKVSVVKNKKSSNLRSLLPGDIIELELEYDSITAIVAYSQLSTTTGTIEEITIGRNNSSIKVSADGQVASYAIVRDTKIFLNGTAASLYDLRVDYTVDINIESNTVTQIDVHAVSQPKTVTGTVAVVNTSLGFINLNVTDSSGNVSVQQVFVKEDASVIGSVSAKRSSIDKLEEGDMLMISGEVNMGAFEASTIILIED
ncbi:MAG: S-layer homology domain-containing protein [Ruminococcaceae bacterium]|nr:S-layer homology domain-containing protein [Oscillospiraceae bacterium]